MQNDALASVAAARDSRSNLTREIPFVPQNSSQPLVISISPTADKHGSTTKLHQTTTEFNCGIETYGLKCQFLVARVHSLPACFGSFPSLREVVNEQEAAIIVPQSLNFGLVQQRYCWT
tara:strand:+ start:14345 stop:14701 length:357 start_codon:yes stop_codon:yes gene_type:complete